MSEIKELKRSVLLLAMLFWVLLWSTVEDGSGGGGFWTLEPMANLNLCSGNRGGVLLEIGGVLCGSLIHSDR